MPTRECFICKVESTPDFFFTYVNDVSKNVEGRHEQDRVIATAFLDVSNSVSSMICNILVFWDNYPITRVGRLEPAEGSMPSPAFCRGFNLS